MNQEIPNFQPKGPFVKQIDSLLLLPPAQQAEAAQKVVKSLKSFQQQYIRYSHIKHISFYLSSLIKTILTSQNCIETLKSFGIIILYVLQQVQLSDYELGLQSYEKLMQPRTELINILCSIGRQKQGQGSLWKIYERLRNPQRLLKSIQQAPQKSIGKFRHLLNMITNIFPVYEIFQSLQLVTVNLKLLTEDVIQKKILELDEHEIFSLFSSYYIIQDSTKPNEEGWNSFYEFLLKTLSSLFKLQNLDKKLLSIKIMSQVVQSQPKILDNKFLNIYFIPLFFDKNTHEQIMNKLDKIMSLWLLSNPPLQHIQKWIDLIHYNDSRVRCIYLDLLCKTLFLDETLVKLDQKILQIFYNLAKELGNKEEYLKEKQFKWFLQLLLQANHIGEINKKIRLQFILLIWNKKESSIFTCVKEDIERIIKEGKCIQFTLNIFEFFKSKFQNIQNQNPNEIKRKTENYLKYTEWIAFIVQSIQNSPQDSPLKSLQKQFRWKLVFPQRIIQSPYSKQSEQLKTLKPIVNYILELNSNKEFQFKILGAFIESANICDREFLKWFQQKVTDGKYMKKQFRQFFMSFLQYCSERFANVQEQQFQILLQILHFTFIQQSGIIITFIMKLFPLIKSKKTKQSIISTFIQQNLMKQNLNDERQCVDFINYIMNTRYENSLKFDILRQIILLSEGKCGQTDTLLQSIPDTKKINIKVKITDANYSEEQKEYKCPQNITLWHFKKLFLKKESQEGVLIISNTYKNIWQQNGKFFSELNIIDDTLLYYKKHDSRYWEISPQAIKAIINQRILNQFTHGLPLSTLFPSKYATLYKSSVQIIKQKNWNPGNRNDFLLTHSQIYFLLSSLYQMRQNFSISEQLNKFVIQNRSIQSKQVKFFPRQYLSYHQKIPSEILMAIGAEITQKDKGNSQKSALNLLQMLFVHQNESFVSQIFSNIMNIFNLDISKYVHCFCFALEILCVCIQNSSQVYWNFIQGQLYIKIYQILFQSLNIMAKLQKQKDKKNDVDVILNINKVCLIILNKVLVVESYSISPNKTQMLTTQQFYSYENFTNKTISEQYKQIQVYYERQENYKPLNIQFWQQKIIVLLQVAIQLQISQYLLQEIFKLVSKVFVLYIQNGNAITKLLQYLSHKSQIICEMSSYTIMLGIQVECKWIDSKLIQHLLQMLFTMKNNKYIFKITEFIFEKNIIPQPQLLRIKEILFKKFQLGQYLQTQTQQSQQLQSIITLLTKFYCKVSQKQKTQLISIIWLNYLFDSKDKGCKFAAFHPKTRQIMYKSILQIIETEKQLDANLLLGNVKDEIQKVLAIQQRPKEKGKGVGLKNIGNICYMNSLLQVLFSIKPFMKGICSINKQFPLLQAFQHLLTEMRVSEKVFISPQNFTLSFDPPINPSIQEDTTEFFINFLAQLQEGDSSRKIKQINTKLFESRTKATMKCLTCNKKRTKQQNYIMYSVEIQKHKVPFSTLQQCLNHAKQPQTIFDLFCEQCECKRDFHKVSQLSQIPKYMFIQLKRLVYDHNTFQKIKIHSELKFPDDLKINEHKLKLVGVITHSGTGQGGHYYTSIRQHDNWLIYNDSRVHKMQQSERVQHWYGRYDMNYSTNAYVLVYENPSKIVDLNLSNNTQIKEIQSKVKQQNNNIILNHILLSQKYAQSFINFTFSLISHPSIKQQLSQIYEALARLSFSKGYITSDKSYLSHHALSQTNYNALIQTLSKYQEYNMQLILHNNQKIRKFTIQYLLLVFRNSRQIGESILYAIQLLKIPKVNNISILKQYIQLVKEILKLYQRTELFMQAFHSSGFIVNLCKLFKERQFQIIMNIQTIQVPLIDQLIQLIMCFQSFKNKEQEIPYFSQYINSLTKIRQTIMNQEQIVELLCMYHKQEYKPYPLIMNLQLEKESAFSQRLINIIKANGHKYMNNQDYRRCKNLCQAIQFLFLVPFYQQQHHKYLYNTLFGCSFPIINYAVQNKFNSIFESRYNYFNANLQNTFISTLTNIVFQIKYQNVINNHSYYSTNDSSMHDQNKEKKKCVKCFIESLGKIYRENKYMLHKLNHQNTLVSPIYTYATFPQFLLSQTKSYIQTQSIQFLEEWKHHIRKISGINNRDSPNPICGQIISSTLVLEEVISQNVRVLFHDVKCYYLETQNNQNLFCNYTDKGKLQKQYTNDPIVSKFMCNNEMEMQEKDKMHEIKNMDVQSRYSKPQEAVCYRKMTIINNSRESKENIHISSIQAKNILVVPSVVDIFLHQKQQIIIQFVKKSPLCPWGIMKVTVNQKLLQIIEKQGQMMQ